MKFEVSTRINRLYEDILSGECPGYTVKWPYRADLFHDKEYNQVMVEYVQGESDMQAKRFLFNVVQGIIDVETEWDDYVQAWKDGGGEELLEAISKLPITEEALGRKNPR